MRLRKKPHTDEKLKQFEDFVTVDNVEPIKKDLTRELFVELGTGMGDFITQIADAYYRRRVKFAKKICRTSA